MKRKLKKLKKSLAITDRAVASLIFEVQDLRARRVSETSGVTSTQHEAAARAFFYGLHLHRVLLQRVMITLEQTGNMQPVLHAAYEELTAPSVLWHQFYGDDKTGELAWMHAIPVEDQETCGG